MLSGEQGKQGRLHGQEVQYSFSTMHVVMHTANVARVGEVQSCSDGIGARRCMRARACTLSMCERAFWSRIKVAVYPVDFKHVPAEHACNTVTERSSTEYHISIEYQKASMHKDHCKPSSEVTASKTHNSVNPFQCAKKHVDGHVPAQAHSALASHYNTHTHTWSSTLGSATQHTRRPARLAQHRNTHMAQHAWLSIATHTHTHRLACLAQYRNTHMAQHTWLSTKVRTWPSTKAHTWFSTPRSRSGSCAVASTNAVPAFL